MFACYFACYFQVHSMHFDVQESNFYLYLQIEHSPMSVNCLLMADCGTISFLGELSLSITFLWLFSHSLHSLVSLDMVVRNLHPWHNPCSNPFVLVLDSLLPEDGSSFFSKQLVSFLLSRVQILQRPVSIKTSSLYLHIKHRSYLVSSYLFRFLLS